MSVPTPALLANLRKPALSAAVTELAPGKRVRPGLAVVAEEGVHDGVVKAKHLRPGQVVRSYLQGQPRGSEKVVATVIRLGATVSITFSTPHPPVEVKAAYRYFDASLVGQPTVAHRTVAAFIEV